MRLSTGGRTAPAAALALPQSHAAKALLSAERSKVARPRDHVRPDFEEVFRRDYPVVVGVARRVLGAQDEAEDVAQDVFVSFARSSVPSEQSRGWLCVAAAHTALNVIRARQRRAARESAAAAPDVAEPDVADRVVSRQERQTVLAALHRLPRTAAVALVLRHSGLSYGEVAAATGISPTSVGTTLRRAEAALRKELNRHAPSL